MTSREIIRRQQIIHAAKKTVATFGVAFAIILIGLLIFSNVVFLTIADRLIRTLGHVSGVAPSSPDIYEPQEEILSGEITGATTSSTVKKTSTNLSPLFRGPSANPKIKGPSLPPPNY